VSATFPISENSILLMQEFLLYTGSCILTAIVTPCSSDIPTGSGLLHLRPVHEISLVGYYMDRILNNDQSVGLILNTGSWDPWITNFLILDPGIEKSIPGFAVTKQWIDLLMDGLMLHCVMLTLRD